MQSQILLSLSILAVISMNLQCQLEWTEILMSASGIPFSSNSSTMLQYSGLKLNNLGNYDSCNSLSYSKYVIIGYNAIPIILQTFCGPSICTEEDYYQASYLIGEESPEYLVIFPEEYQKTYYSDYSESAKKMIMLVLLLVLVGISATIYDLAFKNPEVFLSDFILLFSIKNNLKLFFQSRSIEKTGQTNFEFLNSVRVMSIGWVILGHTYLNNMIFPVVSNIDTAFNEISEAKYILVYGAFYAVDTFFWLSGFFMAYFFLEDLEKSVKASPVKILKVYIHRYLRVTPVYMFCLFFFWTLQIYMGNGPLYVFIDETFFGECKDYWWTNLLYVNNFIPDGKGNGCFGVSWYLGVDMQLSLIGAIVVYLYSKVKKPIGWGLILFFCAVGCISSGLIADAYEMNVSAFSFHGRDEYMSYYYIKPYTRISPYMLGLACAFIVFSSKKTKEKGTAFDKIAAFIETTQSKLIFRLASFAFGVGLINILIFAQYDTYKHPGSDFGFTHWSKKANYAFIAMERLTYGVGISLILLPMLLGYFNNLTQAMCGVLWNCLARLSFVAYLIHENVIGVALKSERDAITYRNYTNIRDTIFFTFLSMLFAFPIVILIEIPLANLERTFRKRIDLRSPQLLVDDDSRISKANEGIELT